MTTTRQMKTERSTGTGREAHEDIDVIFPVAGTSRSIGMVSKLEETSAVADFTDGGAALGTIQMTGSIPAGAVVFGAKITEIVGFAGDTTAVATIGDGTDVDRYNTGTINVFATAAAGVNAGLPSGTTLLTAANQPTIGVTGGSDFTAIVSNGNGSMKVTIYYVEA